MFMPHLQLRWPNLFEQRPSLGSTSFFGQEMEKRKQAEATVQDLDLNLDTSQSEMGKCAGIPSYFRVTKILFHNDLMN
jgi:hypothetical protein